ncbi:nicotinate (nicotinamide) nucleotide adenylyltransferase [Campylobacter canadensis]|uniref:Probable nicotinate-nucleotide adenylyltransferase n=1 Tax=Campylobacter canadensis TaxID=449520 RepID=A0ABS7WRY0_9BACT|nr:nicotinate (nicotinamide) nucleotide adenylyltransferase [Campylobacter canadensis]MBZ7987513.1 nicotinate (nicotinamide) nucleotide adenylyltransferase [Campylobacter canadensis]MBZ7994856.1 nicotinate (nicotinamide) nucleotide adenylyltransferase [Campylobacter canadensis]MBZ7996360.1 nicotinate (nicotinamide) nucleotide adenylyltransferase [Campylobacter canadensis]MBZ7998393.1 nicotinate (nicotinamide) nucleotide adenylyltransferase [Campylobacter canadensis]MBZ8000108.1 nicotinate (nic
MIAIFGGSFDPIHLGHEEVIKEILKLDVKKLFIVPTFINPFKKSFYASPNQRIKWLKMVLLEDERIVISDYEIKQNRPVPSIDTVKYFSKCFQDEKILFIIGADHLKTLHKWHEYEKLKTMVEFVIAKRDNIKIPSEFKTLNVNVDISSSFIRNNLDLSKVNDKIKEDVKAFYKKGVKIEG